MSNQAEAAAVHSEWEVSLRRVHSHDRTHPQLGEGLPFVIVTPCPPIRIADLYNFPINRSLLPCGCGSEISPAI
jgi:hypothetical protein